MTEIEDIVAELKNRKDQVDWLLEHHPHARDNDFYLQYLWLKTFGNLSVKLPFLEWSDVLKIGGKLESVRRVRQHIQNDECRWLPSPDVQAKRRRRGNNFRTAIKRV